jgi:hypothetical protein
LRPILGGGLAPLDQVGGEAELGRARLRGPAAAERLQLLAGPAPVAVEPGAVADQGGQRRQGGRGFEFLSRRPGAGQDLGFQGAQAALAPGGERQLLDPMRLGRVRGQVARHERAAQGGERGRVLVAGQDEGLGAQAMLGGVQGGAGLALGRDGSAGQGAVAAGEVGAGVLGGGCGGGHRRGSRAG